MTPKTASSFSIPWGTLIKTLVSGSLIVWLLSKIDIAKVWEIIQGLSGGVLVLVLLIIWITLFAIAKRWQLVVRLGGSEAPFPGLAEATFIGAFFNQFLPSSVGGDFFRVLAVRRYGASLSGALTGVFMDRLFGFISLGILCLLVIPAEGGVLLASDLKWPFLITLFLLVGVFGGGLLLLLVPKSWHSYNLIRPFHSVIEMVQGALRQKRLLLATLLASFVASILVILGLQVLMVAFDVPLTWEQGAAILPAVMLLTSLPISFAGWGLREGALIIALGVYQVSQETALALSLIYGVLHLVSAVPGLILWILEKRRLNPSTSPL
ncbi:MAG: conserved rane protein of unknown function [Alphaproteobacteria bacterium]|jgi:uncharacterized protein (TIRG00374 family)|nr:conserved rane protein of unknown function [Alphaproteobacteria bacterium]